jgi:hypothetical protein
MIIPGLRQLAPHRSSWMTLEFQNSAQQATEMTSQWSFALTDFWGKRDIWVDVGEGGLVFLFVLVFALQHGGFELRASHLLGRCSITWATPPILLFVFHIESCADFAHARLRPQSSQVAGIIGMRLHTQLDIILNKMETYHSQLNEGKFQPLSRLRTQTRIRVNYRKIKLDVMLTWISDWDIQGTTSADPLEDHSV